MQILSHPDDSFNNIKAICPVGTPLHPPAPCGTYSYHTPYCSCPLDNARATSSTKLGRSVANNLCFRTLFSFSVFVFLFVFCFSVSVSLFFMFLCIFPSPLGQHDSFTAARCRLQFAVCSFRPVAFWIKLPFRIWRQWVCRLKMHTAMHCMLYYNIYSINMPRLITQQRSMLRTERDSRILCRKANTISYLL